MARKNRGGEAPPTAAARIVFELAEAKCRLVHINQRLEKHGEEDRLALDLSLEWDTDNGCLALFSPTLRSALYQRPTGPQSELPGTSGPEHLTEVKYPELMPIKWHGGKLVGAELRFHLGTSDKAHVVFAETGVDKYRLDCKEGGTVTVAFRAQVYPTDVQSGRSRSPRPMPGVRSRGSSAGASGAGRAGSGERLAVPRRRGPPSWWAVEATRYEAVR